MSSSEDTDNTVATQLGHDTESKDGSMSDVLGTFESVVENPFSRFMLRRATAYCHRDGGRKIEVGLDLLSGERESACTSCRFTSRLASMLIKRGAKAFGVEEADVRKQLADPYWKKGLVNVMTGLSDFGVRRPFVPGAPFQVVWNITRACNLKCKHCYENAGRRGADELKDEDVLRGIDVISRANVSSLAFSGGEPTLHPSILDFIGHAKDAGLYVSIATNGVRFSDRETVARFKAAGLGFAQISIDGLSAEVHDGFRGVSGSWNAAVTAVKNCVAEGVTTCISTTVTNHNRAELPGMLDFSRGLGAKWCMLYNFIPTGRGKEMIDMDLSPHERRAALETAFAANCEAMQVLSTAPQYAPVAKKLSAGSGELVVPTHFYNVALENDRMGALSDFIGGCGAGRFYLAVEPNGDVYPCVFFPHTPQLRVGNLVRDDFEAIWRQNELLQDLRDKDLLKGHCPECENRYICGGCRARAIAYFDDPLGPDPGCVNNIAYWEEAKRQSREVPIGMPQESDLQGHA
ncbi:MAG TPA: radical SAM protein [Methanomassiliicoccales archaeon]|nr:radical SAM protein [Methanomassiliicoccales archaeon]